MSPCRRRRSRYRPVSSAARVLGALKNNPNATFDAVNSSYMLWLELNAKVAPLDNVKVRQALNYAIPHADLINTIYYGLADKLSSPMPRIYPMATTEFGRYDYNLEMAKKLLAEAGFASGFKTTLRLQRRGSCSGSPLP
ncbi:ABC transporter substrate-binding protein [Cupriavidus basilensis]